MDTSLVVKKNSLNEMRSADMSLQELRFFTIYLSKIKKDDPGTREQEFRLSDFKNIMELKKIDIYQLKNVSKKLMLHVITVDSEDEEGEYEQFHLFSKCKCHKINGEWYISFKASEEAMPFMFGFKSKYFKYKLWNALSLSSKNQMRMYEILKQYEKIGHRVCTVEELRGYLGISDSQYNRFEAFKRRVLDPCKEAISEKTDIKIDYTPIRAGRGGKINSINFTISKNEKHADRIKLEKYIEPENDVIDIDEFEIEDSKNEFQNLDLLYDACEGEFDEKQLVYLFDLITQVPDYKIPENEYTRDTIELRRFMYLKIKYDKMNAKKETIENRFNYICKMIEGDAE